MIIMLYLENSVRTWEINELSIGKLKENTLNFKLSCTSKIVKYY